MNRDDLAEILRLAEVDPTYYCLMGVEHEALCLVVEGQTWKVFLSERGARYEEQALPDEDAACTYFLKRILALWRPDAHRSRIHPSPGPPPAPAG